MRSNLMGNTLFITGLSCSNLVKEFAYFQVELFSLQDWDFSVGAPQYGMRPPPPDTE